MASTCTPVSVNMFIAGPRLVNTVPTVMGSGAAGGAGLPVWYKPVTAVTVHTWVDGAFTLIVSPNWPLVRVVALFRHTQGSEIVILQLKDDTVTVPVIAAVQPPWVEVATTV